MANTAELKMEAGVKIYGNYINGEWVESRSHDVIVDLNPADTSDVIGKFQQSTVEDARAAIEAAKAAFPKWRAVPAPERGRVMARVAEIARQRADELGRIMTREEGKILREGRGEILKGVNLLEFYAGEGLRMGGNTRPSEMPSTFNYTLREPLGVVALITPWNFPWAIPVWKAAPALVAGNCVVLKPASLTPLMAVKMIEIFQEAGLPKGVLNLVTGPGGTVGEELATNATIKAVSFTGSTGIGTSLYVKAAQSLKKVTCEMGGKNALIVLDDADLELAAEAIVQGAFGSTGQRCTATSRVLVTKSVHDKLLEMIVERAKKIVVGNGLKDGVGMGPAVDKSQYETDLNYIEIAKKDGAKLVLGGRALKDGDLARGYFVEPTVFTGVTPSMRIFKEEVFGPVLAVSVVDSFREAMEAANAVEFGLTSSIYTRDANTIMRYIEGIEVGMVHINSPTVGGEAQVPFGGIKATGVGEKEMAEEGLNFFTYQKTVFYDYTGSKRDTNIY